MNLAEAKRMLRKIMIKERQAVSSALRKKHSKKINQLVLGSSLLKRAKTVAAFIGFGSEVDTYPLIENLWNKNKTVVVPISEHGLSKTYFAVFRPGDPLRKTKYGPLELANPRKNFDLKDIDLVLVPGLAFDQRGYRLGYGGGVYDRLLKKTKKAKKMGLFYSFQRLHHVPTESFDQKLDAVMTEKGLAQSAN